MGFTCPVAIGKGPLGLGYGLLPYRVPTTVVTGPPVPVEKWEGACLVLGLSLQPEPPSGWH